MKRQRNMGKAILSCFLAMMLILQTVVFSTSAYADGQSGSPNVAESPSAPEVEAPSESPSAPEVEAPSESPSAPEVEAPSESPSAPEVEAPSESPSVPEVEAPSKSPSVPEVEAPGESPSAPETELPAESPSVPVTVQAVPTDKTVLFMETNSTFPLQVTQGTVVSPGSTIQGRQAFTLKSEGLKVPVKGDYANTPDENDTTKYIQQGDSIELRRDAYFNEVVLPTATKSIMATTDLGMKQLGIAYFTPDSIKIVFNGDDWFLTVLDEGLPSASKPLPIRI